MTQPQKTLIYELETLLKDATYHPQLGYVVPAMILRALVDVHKEKTFDYTTLEQAKAECEPYAYAVVGNLEQLLFFDKESAERASEINCGTMLSLYALHPDQTALIRELLQAKENTP